MKKSNTKEFIEKAKEKHTERYDYSLVEYITNYTKVKILCQEHGEFEQTPNSHLEGKGCPECGKKQAILKISNALKSNTISFIEKAEEKHAERYDYSLVEYITNQTKVKILCQEHGEFEQTPKNHLEGCGCPECAREKSNYEKYKDKKTTLYYIFLPEHNLYKIGITKSSVESRFKGDIKAGLKIEIIQTKEFQDGYEAFSREQEILHEYRDFRPTKEIAQAAIKVGWTELFTENILINF